MILRLGVVALVGFALVPERLLTDEVMQRTENRPFCERNPHTCAAVGEIWAGAQHKAVLVGRLVVTRLMSEQDGRTERTQLRSDGRSADRYAATQRLEGNYNRGSLSNRDLAHRWVPPYAEFGK